MKVSKTENRFKTGFHNRKPVFQEIRF